MKTISIIATLFAVGAGIAAGSAQALPRTPLQERAFCNVAQAGLQYYRAQIIAGLNARYKDRRIEITARKTLVPEGFFHLEAVGCQATMDVTVSLERKVRRDAHGKIYLTGKITSFDLRAKQVCLVDIRATRVALSNTAGVAEAIYAHMVTRYFRGEQCFSLS